MLSPISNLCDVLANVKAVASQHLPKNETQTRIMLIDPVLKALGWDVANPHLVAVEKHLESGRNPRFVDYMLKVKKPKKPIIIEAKKLGDSLDNVTIKEQILFYASRVNSESIFLTDGLRWHHFTNFDAANLAPEVIDLEHIDNSDLPLQAAVYLIQNLDAALFIYDPVRSDERDDSLQSKVVELERTIRDIENTFRSISEGILERTVNAGQNGSAPPWRILGDQSWDPKNRRPVQLKLPDNQVLEVSGWGQVLTETCQFCLKAKPELMNDLPIRDKAGRSQNLVGLDRPANNHSVLTICDRVVYVNTNYSAVATVANAVHMIEKLGGNSTRTAAVILAD